MIDLARCFFETAARQPDHPLILGQTADEVTTYGAFAAEVRRLAAHLAAEGIGPGTNVGLHHRSGADYIALVYAVWAAGGCITPLPLELTPTEKGHVFDFIHMDAVISEARLVDPIADRLCDGTVAVGEAAVLARVESSVVPPPELQAIDAAFIRFTSGTTGDAKGVVLSHRAIHTRIHAANRVLEVGPHDRILWLLSMDYHFAVSIVAYLTFGASIILPRNTFGVTLLAAAETHRATFIYGAPIHHALMTQDDTGAELPAELRLAIVTTTALEAAAADAFHRRFGRVLNETYGIIELGLPAINTSHDRSKQGSVGRVVPGYDLIIEGAEPAALRAWSQTSLANYKVPATFEWVDALTYTASGKKIRNPARHRPNRGFAP